MPLKFVESREFSIGAELELQILDPETLDLTPKAELILEECRLGGIERVKTEIHQSMLEIDSEISKDVKECRRFLSARMAQLGVLAQKLDLKLAISGTHPFQRWSERLISSPDRYQDLHQKYQWLARRINVYGLHVHIGMKSGIQALQTSNALIRYLPHLLALSANSPFWQGLDTGTQSSRITIVESFPLAGIPPVFKSWSEFEHYYETLNGAGVVSSIKDLYWFIRPNLEFGTLEFRVCDVLSTLDETMALIALIQCLAVFVNENSREHDEEWDRELRWIAPANQWIAARDGLNAIIHVDTSGKTEKISELIKQLIEKLSPIARNLNCFEELQFIHHMIDHGNGAKRQRDIFEQTGSLQEVVKMAMSEFEYQLSLRRIAG